MAPSLTSQTMSPEASSTSGRITARHRRRGPRAAGSGMGFLLRVASDDVLIAREWHEKPVERTAPWTGHAHVDEAGGGELSPRRPARQQADVRSAATEARAPVRAAHRGGSMPSSGIPVNWSTGNRRFGLRMTSHPPGRRAPCEAFERGAA